MVDQAPQPGQVFVQGHERTTARALLDASEELGLDPRTTVRTTVHGFIVPEEVWDAAAERVLDDLRDATDDDQTTEF